MYPLHKKTLDDVVEIVLVDVVVVVDEPVLVLEELLVDVLEAVVVLELVLVDVMVVVVTTRSGSCSGLRSTIFVLVAANVPVCQ